MSATLGGLIKDYRLQKNISQLEIAFALGWKEPSRLSRIEQGINHKPNRETVNRLMTILKLSRNERGQLLLAGGYLPDQSEIDEIVEETNTLIDNWNYPAYILDFSWRLLAWNKHAANVYAITEIASKFLHENKPCSLEVVFSDEFPQNKYLSEENMKIWHKVLYNKLIMFRLQNKARTSEKWYQEFLKKMMANQLFNAMWQKVQTGETEVGISNYEYKITVNPDEKTKVHSFHILRSPLIQDSRFEINYHVPADTDTFRYFS